MKKGQPQRQCIGCAEMKPKNTLVRIVKTPDGNIILDRSGKANGRGAYICYNEECYKKAVKMKKLEKSFSMKIPEEITQQILREFGANE